jgi:hypothetical protein
MKQLSDLLEELETKGITVQQRKRNQRAEPQRFLTGHFWIMVGLQASLLLSGNWIYFQITKKTSLRLMLLPLEGIRDLEPSLRLLGTKVIVR